MINQLTRVGTVTQRYPDRGTVRVSIVGIDDAVSGELPVVCRKTLKDKDYWMPDLEEQVVCLFLGQGLEQGFVLGAIYSQADAVPVASLDKFHKTFKDGTVIEYDRAQHKLLVDVKGDVEVKGTGRCDLDFQGQILIKSAANVTIQAPLIVQGSITATGSIIDSSGNTNHHTHP